MMQTMNLTKYFLSTLPQLRTKNYDNNLKINKLLYFSSLMYYAIFERKLIDEDFERWDNGPVVRTVYTEFRYGDSIFKSQYDSSDFSTDIKKIVQIISFIYGNKTAKELSDETHQHNIWKDTSKNKKMDFKDIDSSLKNYMKTLYSIHQSVDYDSLKKEVIQGNTYLYYDESIDMYSEEFLNEIKNIEKTDYPIFVELLEGELVFS